MSALMQGFVIAIWIVLSFIYFRLGDIRDELKELNKKKTEDTRDG